MRCKSKLKLIENKRPKINTKTNPAEPQKIVNKHLGHRARLRAKFRKSAAALLDYEILELFLFHLIPYKDTKLIAKELLDTFKSFEGVALAEPCNLCKIRGVGASTALALNILGEIFVRKARQHLQNANLLNSWEAVIEYCQVHDGLRGTENVHVLFLNKRFHLIADEVLFSGTVDETPIYLREILKRALELNASSIIVVHNHPSGNTTPSRADIEQTQKLSYAAKAVGITLQDHIIISPQTYTSLRAMGTID